AQQVALLPWVENGTVILIGATTENPFFEVNRALVSRSRIFQLKPLSRDDLFLTARRCLADPERGYGRWRVRFAEGALEHLVEVASGDARSLLNALELAVETTPPSWPPPDGADIFISMEAAEESIQRRAVLYDKDGDYHFDTISAFIKSIRGSDPDAALYWLAKMVRAGEDPAFIFRRMIILASEDVGLADPQAISIVTACAEAFDRIGFPEGNFPLAQAALYLATAPKSNTTLAFFDALAEVEKEDAEVPRHLKDGSRDREGFGHGEGYIYPHAYREHWAAQQYLPTALRGKTFYTPSEIGYEEKIREEVLRKREIQTAMILQDLEKVSGDEEGLTWSAASRGREGWFKRLESSRSRTLIEDRDHVFQNLSIQRYHRILVCTADEGLLLWEALRRTPEGLCAGIVQSEQTKQTLLHIAHQTMPNLTDEELPRLLVRSDTDLPSPEESAELLETSQFEYILGRDLFRRPLPGTSAGDRFRDFATRAHRLLGAGGTLALIASPPRQGQKIAELITRYQDRLEGAPSALQMSTELPSGGSVKELLKALEDAEGHFWNNYPAAWEPEDLVAALEAAGLRCTTELFERMEERLISENDIRAWFDPEKSSWGTSMAAALGPKGLEQVRNLMSILARQGPLVWKWKAMLVHGTVV
ncbi:MAG: AAA family ATPase, partial [Termitinemataceae bacterium]